MTIIPERDVTAEMGETIDLLRADVELLKRVVKERDVTITRLREALELALEWLDCVCDEQDDLATPEGVAAQKKIIAALTDTAEGSGRDDV